MKHRAANHKPYTALRISRILTVAILAIFTVLAVSCANFASRVSAEDAYLTRRTVVPYRRDTGDTSSAYNPTETEVCAETASDDSIYTPLPETTKIEVSSDNTESLESETAAPVTDITEEPDYTAVTCSAEPKTADISAAADTTADSSTAAETTADSSTAADTAADTSTAADTTAGTSTAAETTADTSTAADTAAGTSTAADTAAAKPSSGKVAYLTFDDGPNKKNIATILDTLDEYGVKATFFTVGYLVDRHPELVADCAERGHAIGCHSYDHDYARIQKEGGLEAEISEWETAINNALGEVPDEKLFRFPGGSTKKSELDLKGKLTELATRATTGTAEYDSMLKKCPANMTGRMAQKNFTDTFKYGSSLKNSPLIILLHESYTETADMLGWIIEFLQDEGYSFGTLDELDSSWYY